jgi:hypothetical protein
VKRAEMQSAAQQHHATLYARYSSFIGILTFV